jgi:uroporphyrinogen-III synthase
MNGNMPIQGTNYSGESSSAAPALSGKRIVVTRAPHQAAEMADLLRSYGAEPLFYPCLEIIPPEDPGPLDEALGAAAAGRFDWLVVTSANTAWALAQRLAILDLSLGNLRAAAIGPQTAEAVRESLHLEVEVVAGKHVAEALADTLQPVAGARLFLPQSAIARPVLAQLLREAGAEVMAVDAYQTTLGKGGDDVPHLLAEGKVDALTFTSSSTVRNFLTRLEREGGHRGDLLNICLAAIGPITAKTMAEMALPLAVVPETYTLAGLIAALNTYFAEKES